MKLNINSTAGVGGEDIDKAATGMGREDIRKLRSSVKNTALCSVMALFMTELDYINRVIIAVASPFQGMACTAPPETPQP